MFSLTVMQQVRLSVDDKEWALQRIPALHEGFGTCYWVVLAEELAKNRGIEVSNNTLQNQIKAYEVRLEPKLNSVENN
jgi:hypothetical protein